MCLGSLSSRALLLSMPWSITTGCKGFAEAWAISRARSYIIAIHHDITRSKRDIMVEGTSKPSLSLGCLTKPSSIHRADSRLRSRREGKRVGGREGGKIKIKTPKNHHNVVSLCQPQAQKEPAAAPLNPTITTSLFCKDSYPPFVSKDRGVFHRKRKRKKPFRFRTESVKGRT
jgi:hypothetical protein